MRVFRYQKRTSFDIHHINVLPTPSNIQPPAPTHKGLYWSAVLVADQSHLTLNQWTVAVIGKKNHKKSLWGLRLSSRLSVFLDCTVYLGGRKWAEADSCSRVLLRDERQLCYVICDLPAQLRMYLLTFPSLHLSEIKFKFLFACLSISAYICAYLQQFLCRDANANFPFTLSYIWWNGSVFHLPKALRARLRTEITLSQTQIRKERAGIEVACKSACRGSSESWLGIAA